MNNRGVDKDLILLLVIIFIMGFLTGIYGGYSASLLGQEKEQVEEVSEIDGAEQVVDRIACRTYKEAFEKVVLQNKLLYGRLKQCLGVEDTGHDETN